MSIEAMKQALEALETIADEVFSPYDNQLGNAILALRQIIDAYTLASDPGSLRLRGTKSQPQQEPVGTVKELLTSAAWERLDVFGSTKVYLGTPPAAQRQWIGLTDEERRACAQSPFVWENYLAIEAKLKEKNT
jgi:hypothetical protein